MASATNNTVIRSIPAPSSAVGEDCTRISLWDAANAGNLLGDQAITNNPDPLVLNEQYELAAGVIVMNQAAGAGETDAMAERALKGKIGDGDLYVQYHDGAVGDGTTNVIAGLGRTQIPKAAMTVTGA